MAIYYMTSCRSSEIGFWEICAAKTLAGAKREASRRYDDGYLDSAIKIAVGDGFNEPRTVVAAKPIDGKWYAEI